MCGIADEGCLIKYSNEIISFMKKLFQGEIETAITEFKASKKAKNE
jgi:hypothetical protein